MSWVHNTMIVAAAQVALAQRICSTLAPSGSGSNMFQTGLSATGLAPATHFISSGLIQDNFAALLGNATLTYGACQQVPALKDITLAQVQALYTASTIVGPTRTVTDDQGNTSTIETNAADVIAAAGLKMAQEALP